MITIRKARREDASQIWAIRSAAIEDQCHGHYSAETLQKWIGDRMPESFPDNVERIYYTALEDSEIIGAGAIDLDSGRIDAMCVNPGHIGHGVGKRLIQHLEMLAREASIKKLHLDASLNAVAFYRSCGFAGQVVSQYRSPRGFSMDCVPMEKTLDTAK